jgi:IS1 family transposase
VSEPIYTDRDYLDLQFRSIRDDIAALSKSTTQRIDSHNSWHRRWGKRAIEAAGVAVAAVGVFLGLKS